MRAFKDLPIGRKLTVCILLTSAVVMVLMGTAFFLYEVDTLKATTSRQLSTLGEIIADNSTASLAFDYRDDAAEILAALKGERHVTGACLYDRSGKIFAKYPKDSDDKNFPAGPGKDGFRFESPRLEGFQPVVQRGDRLGTLYLEYDAGGIVSDWLRGSIGIALGGFAFVALVAYALSRILQRQISKPILELAGTARAVAERGDYSVRASKSGEDELGLLTDAFNGMLTQIQTLNQDLERRVVERTAQLQAANRELEAFSYSVSHDLRAPLRHIDGFAALLSKHAAATLDEKGRRYLGTISDAAKRMGQLIDDLLAFSRISRSQINTAELDHDALVASVIRDGRFDGTARQIDWSISPLPRVHADLAMLRQVWANLIGNAVKYSGKNPQPKIVIRGERSASASNEYVFSVSDNGVGFDMAYANKLFGVFQRLHNPADFEGTGIGLANVQRIVTRHKGRVWADGRVGEGATFYFSLPVDPSAA